MDRKEAPLKQGEPAELIPLKEARGRLGISKTKMANLVREERFPVYENPLDRREKLVNWDEVQAALRVPRRLSGGRDAESRE